MFSSWFRGCVVGLAMLMGASVAFAQQGQPTFPKFTPDDPQRIGFVSRLNEERRAVLAGFLDAADTVGFFPPNVEARGADPFGIVLYIFSSWDDAKALPQEIMPPNVLTQLETVPRSYFRYTIPVRKDGGNTFVMFFYIASETNDPTLQCLAKDLVLVLANDFAEGTIADCARG